MLSDVQENTLHVHVSQHSKRPNTLTRALKSIDQLINPSIRQVAARPADRLKSRSDRKETDGLIDSTSKRPDCKMWFWSSARLQDQHRTESLSSNRGAAMFYNNLHFNHFSHSLAHSTTSARSLSLSCEAGAEWYRCWNHRRRSWMKQMKYWAYF